MKNKTVSSLLFIMILFGQFGCSNTQSQEYTKYESGSNSIFNITFSYPKEWQWKIEYEAEDTFMMYAIDSASSDSLGLIGVDVYKGIDNLATQTEMEKDVEFLLKAAELQSRGLQMKHYTSKIDGLVAVNINFEFLSKAIPTAPLSMKETIFLLAGDRYYRFDITIPEDLRNEEFGQGFDHMINTIQILP